MAWFTIGVVVQVTGLATDTSGDSVTVEVLVALAIFGAMLFGIGWPLLGPLGSRVEAAEHVTWAKSKGTRPHRPLHRRSCTRHLSNDPGIHERFSSLIAEENALRVA